MWSSVKRQRVKSIGDKKLDAVPDRMDRHRVVADEKVYGEGFQGDVGSQMDVELLATSFSSTLSSASTTTSSRLGQSSSLKDSFLPVTATLVEDFDPMDIDRMTATKDEVRTQSQQTFLRKIHPIEYKRPKEAKVSTTSVGCNVNPAASTKPAEQTPFNASVDDRVVDSEMESQLRTLTTNKLHDEARNVEEDTHFRTCCLD